jgi:uncharacterized FAD-dependent dehydrogenase
MKTINLRLSPRQAADKDIYVPIAARMAGVGASQVALARVTKRSIDARGGGVKVNLTVEIFVEGEPLPAPVRFDYQDVSSRPEVVVVGSGPAGMFCALRLIELGLRPIVLERGKPVSERKRDIAQINRGEEVDPDSNYAFGEGGAGTFSDGKLFTRSKKRGDHLRALQRLVFHGASDDILWDAHPHIGTDKLPRVMTNMREAIVAAGGTVLFGARVTDLVIKEGRVAGVEYVQRAASGESNEQRECGYAGGGGSPLTPSHEPSHMRPPSAARQIIEGMAVVLATGHSARDVYEMLHRRGVALEAKPFAMGVRVEHPQALIDSIQYHGAERGEWLPAAEYRLVEQVTGRGVWSFCMCPGGFIVPAMTSSAECVVNGMSPSQRNSPWANSAIVTEVRASDFAHLEKNFGPLAGLEFQRRFEVAARKAGGDRQMAPAQRVGDFLARRGSHSLPKTSYVPGLTPSDLGSWMPEFITRSLRGGLTAFGKRMRGFTTNDAVLVGVESRTSTPVRIPRDAETLEHTTLKGLYPAGEGAGYAGGIISAALDGERIAECVLGACSR